MKSRILHCGDSKDISVKVWLNIKLFSHFVLLKNFILVPYSTNKLSKLFSINLQKKPFKEKSFFKAILKNHHRPITFFSLITKTLFWVSLNQWNFILEYMKVHTVLLIIFCHLGELQLISQWSEFDSAQRQSE